MSWVFARMLMLVFPVALFFLGIAERRVQQGSASSDERARTALGAGNLEELAKDAEVLEAPRRSATRP